MVEPLLTFVQISDTHLLADPNQTPPNRINPHAAARAVITQVNALPFPVDFVLHTGDVGNDPTEPASYTSVRDTLAGLTAPLHVIPGNHDNAQWLTDIVGARPAELPYYTFDRKGVRFILLRSNVPNAPYGTLGDEQFKWLDELLARSSMLPVVVAIHHHPLPIGSDPIDAKYGLTDGEAFHSLLVKSRPRIACVLFGHIHETTVIARDGITYVCVQSTWYQLRSSPGQTEITPDSIQVPGYNVISIMPNGTAIIRAFRANPEG